MEPPANLPHHFEHLLLALAKLYSEDPLNLQLELDYWCPSEGVQPSPYPYRSAPRQVRDFMLVYFK